MKVAIFSDIHGNFPALKAAVEHSIKVGCERYLFLGDYVGYFSFSKQVVEFLMDLENADFIKGNHEIILENIIVDCRLKSDTVKKYGYGHQDAIESLSSEQFAWLQNMSEKKSVEIDGFRLLLTHGSPNSINEYIYPDTEREYLESLSDRFHDIILMGHTHYQFYRQCNHSLLINPGSVGQARDIRGLASYVVLDLNNMVVSCNRIPYNKNALLEKIIQTRCGVENLFRSLGESIGKF